MLRLQNNQDGRLTLSVVNDLTANPLTGNYLNSGVIKIVGAALTSTASSITPLPEIRAWATQVHANPRPIYNRDGVFRRALERAGELKGLEQACSFIYR
jgi:hypothetical protein